MDAYIHIYTLKHTSMGDDTKAEREMEGGGERKRGIGREGERGREKGDTMSETQRQTQTGIGRERGRKRERK